LDVLGYGYDVTKEYLALKSISSAPVLDIERLYLDHPTRFNIPTTSEGEEHYYYGGNASDFVSDINKKRKFNASATIGTKDPEKNGDLLQKKRKYFRDLPNGRRCLAFPF